MSEPNVSSKDSWEPPHTEIYNRLLDNLTANPPKPPAGRFLLEDAPRLLRDSFGHANGCGFNETGNGLAYRPVMDGEEVIHWTGSAFTSAPFSNAAYYVGEYVEFAKRILALAGGRETLVLDLGAGTCLQAVALRVAGCNFPILNLDYFELIIGQRIVEGLGLSNMLFGAVDINAALAQQESAAALKRTILSAADGLPILALSRYAIHGFYTEPEYQRLFRFLLNDVGAIAGLHLEMCGHKTPTYRAMQKMSRIDLLVARKSLAADGDPLTYLQNHPQLEVIQREEVWPHHLNTRFPSFISWKRKG